MARPEFRAPAYRDSGIGRAVSVLFAREGADVQSSAFCSEAVERTVKEFGRLDVLVNNAAYQQHQESIEDITNERLDRTSGTLQ